MFLKSGCVFLVLLLATVLGFKGFVKQGVASGNENLTVVWTGSQPEQMLKVWDSSQLAKLKKISSSEKDPTTGKTSQYQGVQLSQVLEQSMENLPVERRALVDLVVFKNAKGQSIFLPRSVIVKYSGMLAFQNNQISLVMPWSSKPKLMQEALPVESYQIDEINRIELASYEERFGTLFLKRRTDPLAVRGEKIFVQNCLGCHSSSAKDTAGRGLASLNQTNPAHPEVRGAPKLTDRDRRALINYLDKYRGESSATPDQLTRSP